MGLDGCVKRAHGAGQTLALALQQDAQIVVRAGVHGVCRDGIAVRALGASHVLVLAAKQGAQIAMRICAPKASRSGIAVRTLGAVHVLALARLTPLLSHSSKKPRFQL